MWIRHILTGDLSFCSERNFTNDAFGRFSAAISPESPAGRCGIIYPSGVALTKLPFLLGNVNLAPGGDPTRVEQLLTVVLPIVLLSLIVLMLASMLAKMEVDYFSRTVAIASMTLGTGLYHYTVFDGEFSHIYSAFWVTATLWGATRGSLLGFTISVIAASMMILTRNTNVLLFPAIVAAAYTITSGPIVSIKSLRVIPRQNLGYVWFIALGSVIGVAIQLYLNYWFRGSFTLSSYGDYSFQFERWFFPEVMLSYTKGLFTWYPLFSLALVLPLIHRRSFSLGVVNLATVLVFATMYGFWFNWQLGASFGHRGFVEIVPLVAIAFACSIDASRFKVGLALAAAVLSLVCVVLMLAYWRGAVPFADTVGEQYWAAVMMRHLAAWEILTLLVATIASVAVVLLLTSALQRRRLAVASG